MLQCPGGDGGGQSSGDRPQRRAGHERQAAGQTDGGEIGKLPEDLGSIETLLADTGYFSVANVDTCLAAGIAPLIAMGTVIRYTKSSVNDSMNLESVFEESGGFRLTHGLAA
jgi:hypothetical protein